MAILRSILGVLAGLVAAVIVIFVAELGGLLFHPLPPGFDPADRQAFREHAAKAPAAALLVVIAAHGIGTLAGAWLAAKIAARAHLVHAFIVGALVLVAGLFNMASVPHPIWFVPLDLLAYPAGAWLGGFLAASAARTRTALQA